MGFDVDSRTTNDKLRKIPAKDTPYRIAFFSHHPIQMCGTDRNGAHYEIKIRLEKISVQNATSKVETRDSSALILQTISKRGNYCRLVISMSGLSGQTSDFKFLCYDESIKLKHKKSGYSEMDTRTLWKENIDWNVWKVSVENQTPNPEEYQDEHFD